MAMAIAIAIAIAIATTRAMATTMTVSITPTDVRDAGDLDVEKYPDTDLEFAIDLATAVVTDELAPHSTNETRLELTASLLAAAYATDERVYESVQQESASVSFDTDRSMSLWRKALQADPTGRLGDLDKSQAAFEVF